MKRISLIVFLSAFFYLLTMVFTVQAANIVVQSKENDFNSYTELLPGEKINLRLGSVEHYLETVSIEGNGLPIKLGHSFRVSGYGDRRYKEVFLQVPELTGMTPRGQRNYHIDDGSDGDGAITVSSSLYNPNTLFKCSRVVLPTDAQTSVLYSDHYDGYDINNRNDLVSSVVQLKIGHETISFFPKKYGLSTQISRFPSKASFISASNWYIHCATSSGIAGDSVFKIVSPDGVTYTFDPYKEYKRTRLAVDFYPNMKVSSITDKHGNRLDYSYTALSQGQIESSYANVRDAQFNGDTSYPYLYNALVTQFRIKSISAKDGRKVNVIHSGQINSLNKGITIRSNSITNPINLRYVSAGSGSNIITTITRKNGKFWRYRYSNTSVDRYVGGKLNSVEYPNGLKVDYVYLGLLKKRTVSGPSLDYIQDYSYQNTGGEYGTNTTFVKSLNQSIEYKYKNRYFVNNPLDTKVNTGRLISKTIFPAGTTFAQRAVVSPLKEVSYEYTREGNVIDLNYLKSKWNIRYGWDSMIGLLEGTHYSYKTKLSKKVTQLNGYTFTTSYDYDDVYGQLKTITESNTLGNSRITRKTYHNDKANWIIGKLASESVDGESAKSSFIYNNQGELTRKTIHTISEDYIYYADGNLKQILQGGIAVSTFSDYYRGIARNTTDGEGNTKRTEVYDFGQVKSETDFNGNPATYYKYDALHRLKKVTPPLQAATTITWPTELKQIITRGNYKKTVEYNAMMQPIREEETDTAQNRTIYTTKEYDDAGRLVYSSFPKLLTPVSGGGAVWGFSSSLWLMSIPFTPVAEPPKDPGKEFEYDGLNRILSIKNTVDGTTTSYCYGNSCGSGTKHGVLITDARGFNTVKNYRAFGNPDSKTLVQTKQEKTNNVYITTDIVKGKLNQTKRINQGGKSRTFFYKTGTLLLDHKTEPEVGTTRYTYDARGNTKTKRVGASPTTTYYYDNNDRVTFIDYPGSTKDVTYNYQGSNLEKITTGNSDTVLDYIWNTLNQIKYETLTIDGMRFVTHYKYDNLGNLDSVRLPSIEYPSSARVIDVNNDALGRTRSITGFVSGIKYFANGVLSDMQYTNGSVFKSTLNANKLPEMVRTLNGSNTIVNLNYAYDADNNVSSITDYRDSINTRTMDYDGLGRMTKANGRWGAGNFTYNDNHDISTLNLGSKHIAYHYNATGKLASTTGTVAKNFSYDHYGNVSGNGKDNFIYDDANQMLRVSNQNINYTYDGNKKRVKVKTPSKTVYYFYNLAGELLYRYDKTNKKDIEYINLNGKLIAKFEQSRGRSNRTTYYHYDLLGSPVANTNASGNILWREEYSPWGKKLLNQDATKDNVRGYTGHVHDKETGLTYMQARYYDPDIVRFMGIDPVGFKENNPIMFNRYAYANNNPFKFVDPNGEYPSFAIPSDYFSTGKVAKDFGKGFGEAGISMAPGVGLYEGINQLNQGMYLVGAVSILSEVPIAKPFKGFKTIKNVDPELLNRTHSISGKRSTKKVNKIAESMKQEGYIGEGIDVVQHDGKNYIIDGHHRAAAARRTKTKVHMKVIDDVADHPSGFDSIDDVIESSESVDFDRVSPKW